MARSTNSRIVTAFVASALLVAVSACNVTAPDPTLDPSLTNHCSPGYTGADCKTCAFGYQDRDGNGFCAASCAGVTCNLHEQCDDSQGRAICQCILGYARERDMKTQCVFRGGPRDYGFDNGGGSSVSSPWAATGSASISPGASTELRDGFDPGWAQFSGTGRVAQSFDMPAWNDSEPLALEIGTGCENNGVCSNVDDTYTLRINGRGMRLPIDPIEAGSTTGSPNNLIKRRAYCLGDAVYGGRVDISASTYARSTSMPERNGDGVIDHLRFTPSTVRCPAPGEVRDGDFEDSFGSNIDDQDENFSWIRTGQNTVSGDATVYDFIGTNGSRAAKLVASTCEGPGLKTHVSIPSDRDDVAISFNLASSNHRANIEVALGDQVIGIVRSASDDDDDKSGSLSSHLTPTHVCVPDWARGFVHSLVVRFRSDCDITGERTAILDDFKITSDPSCKGSGANGVVDSSFEASASVTSSAWLKVAYETASSIGGDSDQIVVDPPLAHTGSAYLSLTAFCGSAERDQWVTVPPMLTGQAGGPALKYFYRTKRNEHGGAFVHVDDRLATTGWTALPTADRWTERHECISAAYAGLSVMVHFSASSTGDMSWFGGGGGSGGDGEDFDPKRAQPFGFCNGVPHTLDIDDVSVITDPACPSVYIPQTFGGVNP